MAGLCVEMTRLKIASKIYTRFWGGKKATTIKEKEVLDLDKTSLLPARAQAQPLFPFDDKDDAASNVLQDFFDLSPEIISLSKISVCSPLILPFSAPLILNLFFLQTAPFYLRQPRPSLHSVKQRWPHLLKLKIQTGCAAAAGNWGGSRRPLNVEGQSPSSKPDITSTAAGQ